MKVRCEYCKNYIDDSEEKCPKCGAVNKDYRRTAYEMPASIEEFKQWYKDRNLPPYETTRFFIGEDCKEPKAFGVYKDPQSGRYIVYKNKEDGSRAIRYEGKDEKYAVNELYLKLKEEVGYQKNLNYSSTDKSDSSTYSTPYGIPKKPWISVALVLSVIFVAAVMFGNIGIGSRGTGPSRGYYNINGTEYYYVNGNWYWYKDDSWLQTSTPEYDGTLTSYYDKRYFDGSSSFPDIKSSSIYDTSWDVYDSWSSTSSWDSDLDWDYGGTWDVDYGGIDWNSDWFKKR